MPRRLTRWSMTSLNAVALSIAVSGCNRPPAPAAASHPPAADLVCAAEPPALTDAQIDADLFGIAERQFTVDALIAGRSCRDALARVCQWHKDRGAKAPERCVTASRAR